MVKQLLLQIELVNKIVFRDDSNNNYIIVFISVTAFNPILEESVEIDGDNFVSDGLTDFEKDAKHDRDL